MIIVVNLLKKKKNGILAIRMDATLVKAAFPISNVVRLGRSCMNNTNTVVTLKDKFIG